MAPGLVETQTEAPAPAVPVRQDNGYKEAFAYGGPKAYKHEQELTGTATQPPASYPAYLPTWPDKKSVY
jgi:sulfonate dioxygenase